MFRGSQPLSDKLEKRRRAGTSIPARWIVVTGRFLLALTEEVAPTPRIRMELTAQTGAAYSTTQGNGSEKYNASRYAKIPCRIAKMRGGVNASGGANDVCSDANDFGGTTVLVTSPRSRTHAFPRKIAKVRRARRTRRDHFKETDPRPHPEVENARARVVVVEQRPSRALTPSFRNPHPGRSSLRP
jgi:hypothetical protein